MRAPSRAALLVGGGLLVLQLAWLVAVPPFRGADETDHAYRAAGAARGQWHLTRTGPDGSGELVDVPVPLQEAATPQCVSRPGVNAVACAGVPGPEGLRTVTTTAGSYNPLFYWVIGTAGLVADGAGSLYAMRLAGVLLCWVAVVAGLACLAAARAGPAVWFGVVAGLTPAFVYSAVVASPNGLEMAAGFALWASLLAVVELGPAADGRPGRWMLAVAGGAATALVTMRALGPLWTLLILASVVVYAGRARVVATVRRHVRTTVVVSAVVAVAAVAGVAWTVTSGLASAAGGDATAAAAGSRGSAEPGLYSQVPLHTWVVQAIAAFPYRDQVPNPTIHVCVALVLSVLVVMGVRRGSGSERAGLLLAVVLSVAAPAVLVLTTLGSGAAEWQGRYTLPFLVGIPVMAGWVVQGVPWRSRFGAGPMTGMALALLGMAQVWSVVWVQFSEQDREVSAGDPHWVHGPPLLTAALATLGVLCCALGVHAASRARERTPVPA